MIVFPLLNPQMIKVAFASWFLNFNSIKENEADQSFEGSISSFFFPLGSVNSITILPTNM